MKRRTVLSAADSSESVTLSIPMRPVPLERHRHIPGRKPHLPKRSAAFRKQLQFYMRQGMRGKRPLEGPLSLSLTLFWKRPKSGPNSKPEAVHRWSKSRGPDASNLQKGIEDAGNEIVWGDDAQICRWFGEMRWANEDGIKITVYRLEEPES